MVISQSKLNKLKENYETLKILEAIDAFYQINGLVNEETQKHPCQLHDSLMQLHRCLLTLVGAHAQKEGLNLEILKKLITVIEEDTYRIIDNTDHILAVTYKIKRLFSF